MTTLLLLHGNEQVAPKYEAALPGARLAVVRGLSVDEYAALGRQSIAGYLDAEVPGWTRPLVVAAFSAGGFALREFLKSEGNRATIDGAVFLDATYGASGGSCPLAPYEGVVAYANGGGRTVITYSASHPAPATCAHAIKQAAPSVELVPSTVADHGAQLSEVGPQVVRRFAHPASKTSAPRFGVVATVGALVGALVAWRLFSP